MAGASTVQAPKSLSEQKLKALVLSLESNSNLGDALLVAFGVLFLLLAFPFYPLPIIPFIALAAGAVAYKFAPFGTLAGIVLAFPAVAYQSTVFAWLYSLILAITLFEMFGNWHIISLLEILILAPFAPFPFSLLSGFVFLAMALASLMVGSRKSTVIAVPCVFLVLLLSSLWAAENNAFMPIRDPASTYSKLDALQRDKPAVGFGELGISVASAFSGMMSGETITGVNMAVGKVAENMLRLLFEDSAAIQLVSWAALLYFIGYVPGRMRGKHKQALASLALLLAPVTNYLVSLSYNIPFNPMVIFYALASIFLIALAEHFGVNLSRERLIVRAERAKQFGKFGLQDLAGSEGAASLDDVGGYEDVKSELKQAIVVPLTQKELSLTYGIKPPTGVLLFGPPGTGKTMLMRALSKELSYGFYYVKCSDLLSQWYGESLPYDEKIMIMGDGKTRLEKIGKVVGEKIKAKVLSFDERGKAVFAEIKDYIKHRCTSPIYEVRTRSGRRIKVTGYHSLFTLNGGRVEGVETSKLVPGSSYIAVPSKIDFMSKPVEKLDFLAHLRNEDFGLYVKNAKPRLAEAVKKLGSREVCSLLGLRSVSYLKFVMSRNIGVRAAKFLSLMERAGIGFDSSEILISAGKKKLPAELALSEELALFLGLWVAEGSYNREDTVRISTSEGELEQIGQLCEKLFGKVTVYAKGKGKGRDIYIGSRPLYVFMRHFLGLEHGAGRKKAPPIAFSFSRKNLAAFLRGYFSGDGSIYENQKGFGMVEAGTVSSELASQLLYLLLYFGIVGTVYERRERTGAVSKRIYLAGSAALSRFGEIGFLSREKNKRLELARWQGGWHRSEQIPITGALRGLLAERIPKFERSMTIGKSVLASEGDGEWLEEAGLSGLLEHDIYWDRVESITRVADEEFVYDISVDPCQNFAGGFGGIFAHNSEKNISELFTTARKNAPCILFFDEIDALAKKRDAYQMDEVAPRVLSVFLEEMDGFKEAKNVIVIGATNQPEALDPAILRPGRFDKIIYMHLPDKKAREAIIKVHLKPLAKNHAVADDIDYARLAHLSERYSGADLKNIVSEAAAAAAKEASEGKEKLVVPVSMKHLTNIIKRVRPSVSIAQLEDYDKFKLDFERRTGAAEQEGEGEKREEAVKWDDVAGLESVREALKEAIELPLLHEELIKQYKIKPSKGVLMFGPPGCGKTLIVKAAANELAATFLVISGAELVKKGYSNAVQVIKETFNRAREQTPALIFMDEIESIASSRDMYGGNVLAQLLVELDGMKELKNVVLIGATNKPGILDPAILRPGRFDKIIYIPPPDMPARRQIFELNLAAAEKEKGFDTDSLARMTDGFSGADIASICQEAKMAMVREKLKGRQPTLTAEAVMRVAKSRRPSITKRMLAEYAVFLEEYGERGGSGKPAERGEEKEEEGEDQRHYR